MGRVTRPAQWKGLTTFQMTYYEIEAVLDFHSSRIKESAERLRDHPDTQGVLERINYHAQRYEYLYKARDV